MGIGEKSLKMWEGVNLLLDRLPERHPEQDYLKKEFYRYEAGWQGEKRLVSKMIEFHWPEPYELLWDVGLQFGNWKVQLDGLLVTPRCIIIIESKNISGRIHFDEVTSEFYRFNTEGEKGVFEDPLVQLSKHERFLEVWLNKKKIGHPPITGMVAFTSRHCEFIAKPAGKHICKTYQVIEELYRILEMHEPLADSPRPIKTRRLIESNLCPYERPPLCEYYRIDPRELKTGVKCSECGQIAVERLYKIWRCNMCGGQSTNAHELALQEYFTLVSKEIDSREFRRFTGIKSRHAAFRILSAANLMTIGSKRNRKYLSKK